jgi:excisionase family DNA binding protein
MKADLSITEIAKITGKERSTVVRWVKSGEFVNVRKIGNEYHVPIDSFKKWWDQISKSEKAKT